MQESIVCGQCGTVNPPSNKFCGNCGAVLAANPAPASVSLPDWLHFDSEATPASTPKEQTSTAVQAPTTTEPVDDLPAWLREHVEALPPAAAQHSTPDAELPSWLSFEADAAALPTVAADADAALPQRAPEERGGASLPDWLADLGVSDSDVGAPPPAPTVELPAWLQESSQLESGESPQQAAQPELPDWLRDGEESRVTPAAGSHASSSGPASLPSWLHAESDEQAMPGQAVAPDSSGAGLDSSSLPAWLRDDQIHPEDKPNDLLPSWLQEERTEPPAGPDADLAQHSPVDEQPSESTGMPSWLTDMASVPAGSAEGQSATGGTPSWLVESSGSPADAEQFFDDAPLTTPAPGESAPGTASLKLPPPLEQAEKRGLELPAWLMPTADEQDGISASATFFEQPAGADEFPPWLHDDQLSGVSDHSEPAQSAAPSSDLPPWLQEIDAAAEGATPMRGPTSFEPAGAHEHVARTYSSDDDTTVAGATATNGHAADLPSWLSDAEPVAAAAPSDLPSWLSGQDQSVESSPVAGRTEGDGAEFLGGLDLPAWLRDAEPAAPAVAAETAPAWLHGLESEVAVAPEPAPLQTPAVPARPEVQRTPERVAAMELLQRLVAEPVAEPTFVQSPRHRPRGATILQVVAFVVLLVAILAALLGPRLPLGAGASVPSESVAALATRIAALPQGTPVLLAYEWDARRVAEMGPLEDAIVAKLTTRRTPLLLMTTDPQGALLSGRRASLLRESQDKFYSQAGLGFVDLGYKPGGSLALARLASNFGSIFEQDWAGTNLSGQHDVIATMCQSPGGAVADCSLDRIGMVIVMADESEDARVWMEQVASAHPGLPVTFVAPAELAPLIRPYLTRPDVTMVTGLSDAVGLQQFGGSADERLARRADATTIGGAVFGLLVLAGMGPALWAGRRARSQGKASVWER